MSPLNSPESELSSVRDKLRSIESLLYEVLQQHTRISARLAELQNEAIPSNPGQPSDAPVPGPAWTRVGRGKKRPARSLSLFSPGDDNVPLLSNFFSTLDEPPQTEAAGSLPPAQQPASAPAQPKASRKRRSAVSPTTSPAHHGKRVRPNPSPPRAEPERSPGPGPSSGIQVTNLQSNKPSPATASAANTAHMAPASTGNVKTGNATPLLFPSPERILVGDSMVRNVAIPNGITYSFSGAKVIDILYRIPSIIERHPSAHIVIVHCGVNDLRCRQSFKLRQEYELLITTIQSLGKTCIVSGLIPTLRRGMEMFSRLYSADQWLDNFSSACGHEYINNFDLFWKKPHLYKHDNLHLNSKGIQVLATNISHHLSSTV